MRVVPFLIFLTDVYTACIAHTCSPRLDACRQQLVGFPLMNSFISVTKSMLRIVLLPVLFLSAIVGTELHGSHYLFAGRNADSRALVQEKARSAFDFVNSIGVNTHLNYFDRTYGNFNFVEQELRSIGILHLRDGVHLQNADYNNMLYSRWIELGKYGIRFDGVLDPRSKLGPLTPALLEHVQQLSGHTIESFEGPNELDISGMSDWFNVARDYQSTIFTTVKSLPDASHIRVIGPSLAIAAHGVTFVDDTLNGFDEGNLHPYPAAKMPSAVFPEQTELARQIFGDKPIVITESGYHNALNDYRDQPGVTEQAAAKYILRLFLEDFARGIPRTYLYEFLDEAPDPGLDDNQLHWGLIRADGTEKPAFVAIKRLIKEASDNAEPASPMQLDWSLSLTMPTIHHVLLQKSSGELDLILWEEVPSYDIRGKREISNPPTRAVLTLGQKARLVTLYEPAVQDASLQNYENTATIPVEIPDHPLVVAISLR
jgi:hypothetical protein